MKVREKFPIKPDKIQKILLRATNWVGDAVMGLPALAAIRQNFPRAEITILVRPWVEGVYKYCPDIDKIMIFDQQKGFLSSRYRVIRQLHKQRFDLAILLQNAFDAALITFLAGIPCRVGYNTDSRSWLLTHSVSRSKEILDVHQVYYYLGLPESLGWSAGKSAPCLIVPEQKQKEADQYLHSLGWQEKDLLLGFNPGAFFGSAKRWFPKRYAAIADRAFEQFKARCIIFGSAKDVPVAREMVSMMKSKSLLAAGKTRLEELPGLMKRCSVFITNDSGLMHMAAALRIPVVAVFGSTNPRTTSPYGQGHTVIYKQTPCSPCLRRECPSDHRCMQEISVDEVWQAVKQKIEKGVPLAPLAEK